MTNTVERVEVSLCADCLTFNAIGWDEAHIGRPLPEPAPMGMLAGWLAGPDETDHVCEGHYSRAACDGCGTRLEGTRFCFEAVPAP